MDSQVKMAAQQEATAVLEGYCSTHPESELLGKTEYWREKAKALLAARELDVLQALSPETLLEIAEGRLDMAEVYRKARVSVGHQVKRGTHKLPSMG